MNGHPKGCRHWGAPHTQVCAPQWRTPQEHPAPKPDPELTELYSRAKRPGPAIQLPGIESDSARREAMLRNSAEQHSRTLSTTHHSIAAKRERDHRAATKGDTVENAYKLAELMRPSDETASLAERLGVKLF
jgi:hypothetical protein